MLRGMTRGRLSRDQILDAALRLADEEGLPALSMRAVAQRLEVTPMALYRHVGDKDGLLDALVERLLTDAAGEPELRGDAEGPTGGPDWADLLAERAAAIRATARRHPAAFGLLLSRRAGTPSALQSRDRVLAALAAAGVPADDVPRLERVLSTFVIGFAASEANGRFADLERADADFDYALGLLARLIDAAAGR